MLWDATGISRDASGQTTVNTARPESAESCPPPQPMSAAATTTAKDRRPLLITRLLITGSLLLDRPRSIAGLDRDCSLAELCIVGLAGGLYVIGIRSPRSSIDAGCGD